MLYTALPRLTHDLAASASERLWIVNAYRLVMAGLLPAFGTLGDRYGHKRFFVTGLAVFGAASLLAAFAPTPGILIAARVILAVGAAMMMPATLSIIRITFTDDRECSLAIGIWTSVSSGGAGLGPIIGGFLLEHFWWGSVFLINIPIVIIALIASTDSGEPVEGMGFIGSVQILIGLVGLVFAVKEMSRLRGNLTVGMTAGLIGAVAMFFFIKRQRKSVSPLIDLQLFKNPRFTTGVLTAILANFALIGMEFVFTQRFQLVMECHLWKQECSQWRSPLLRLSRGHCSD